MKKIIIFTLLLLLTTLPSTAKGIKTHMDGMRQHGGARSAIPSVMVDQESAYVMVDRNTTNLDFETSNNGHYNQDLKLYPNVRKK